MTIVNCASCQWFARNSEAFGVCRRNAPSPSHHPATGINPANWPTVFAHSWCGDWRPQSQELNR
jgi:hypothetical protein